MNLPQPRLLLFAAMAAVLLVLVGQFWRSSSAALPTPITEMHPALATLRPLAEAPVMTRALPPPPVFVSALEIDLGRFDSLQGAEEMQRRAAEVQLLARIVRRDAQGLVRYVVVLGPFDDMQAVEALFPLLDQVGLIYSVRSRQVLAKQMSESQDQQVIGRTNL